MEGHDSIFETLSAFRSRLSGVLETVGHVEEEKSICQTHKEDLSPNKWMNKASAISHQLHGVHEIMTEFSQKASSFCSKLKELTTDDVKTSEVLESLLQENVSLDKAYNKYSEWNIETHQKVNDFCSEISLTQENSELEPRKTSLCQKVLVELREEPVETSDDFSQHVDAITKMLHSQDSILLAMDTSLLALSQQTSDERISESLASIRQIAAQLREISHPCQSNAESIHQLWNTSLRNFTSVKEEKLFYQHRHKVVSTQLQEVSQLLESDISKKLEILEDKIRAEKILSEMREKELAFVKGKLEEMEQCSKSMTDKTDKEETILVPAKESISEIEQLNVFKPNDLLQPSSDFLRVETQSISECSSAVPSPVSMESRRFLLSESGSPCQLGIVSPVDKTLLGAGEEGCWGEGSQVAFPSLPIPKLNDMHLLPTKEEKTPPSLNEAEACGRCQLLALSFRTDNCTIGERLGLHFRARSLAESNASSELQMQRQMIEELRDSSVLSTEFFWKMKTSLDVLERCVCLVSQKSELLGAVEQEHRISLTMDSIFNYIDFLQLKQERNLMEISETRTRLLSIDDTRQQGGSQVPKEARAKFQSAIRTTATKTRITNLLQKMAKPDSTESDDGEVDFPDKSEDGSTIDLKGISEPDKDVPEQFSDKVDMIINKMATWAPNWDSTSEKTRAQQAGVFLALFLGGFILTIAVVLPWIFRVILY